MGRRSKCAVRASQVLALLALSGLPCSAQTAPDGRAGRLAPPTVADPIRGLDLWRGAKVGMDVAAVRRQFPGAAATAQPTTLTGGQTDMLELRPLDLEGHAATAHFYFSAAGLAAVELTPSDLRPGDPVGNLRAVEQIAAAYSARYGQGYDCGSKGLADINVYECKWLNGRVAIQLWYMDVAGQAPLAYVAYRQADDPSYNL